MTYTEYNRKRTFLLEVLKDAEDRGDYFLEHDVKEQLIALQNAYYGEDQE